MTLALKENQILINENIISLEDITKMKIFATHQHFNKYVGATSLPYNDYFYFIELHTKKNEVKYLTSLLSYDLDIDLKNRYPDVPVINVVKAFPLIDK